MMTQALILAALAVATSSAFPANYPDIGALYSQYHAQDELGQYSFGYSGPASSKHEQKTADGVTRGSYSYVDPLGRLQSRSYTADDVNGFRVAASDLPVGPATSQGVAAASPSYQASSYQAPSYQTPSYQAPSYQAPSYQAPSYQAPSYQAQSYQAQSYQAPSYQAPSYKASSWHSKWALGHVEDTPEVAAAKAQHLAAVEQVKLRNAAAAGSGSRYVSANPSHYYSSSAAYPLEHRYVSAPLAPYNYQSASPALAQTVALPSGISSQYHAQDEAGQYTFGYANDVASKSETKTLDGVTRGSYSYLDPNGQIQSRSYVADDGGFRVVASDLPQVNI